MYEDGERINNQSVRERFELSKNDSSIASRIISDTLEAGLIKHSSYTLIYIPKIEYKHRISCVIE